MPDPQFRAKTEKTSEHSVTLARLDEAWVDYLNARKFYVDARLSTNYKHRGMNNAEENLVSGNKQISETYAAYKEAIIELKAAHNLYKASMSGLIQGHLL